MILESLIFALALDAQISFKDSKVILANGDTVTGPCEITTDQTGFWSGNEYAGLSLSGKSYGADEIKSAQIGDENYLSLRKNGVKHLGRVVFDGKYAKTISFSPPGYDFGLPMPGPNGSTMNVGAGVSSSVHHYTVNMEDAEAINYANLIRDVGACPRSHTDLMVHKTLVYSVMGTALAAVAFGTTAAILWNEDRNDHSRRHDALINGLGATAAVSGIIFIGCTIGLGTDNFDHFLKASIKHFRK
jgi:hypothetical protein